MALRLTFLVGTLLAIITGPACANDARWPPWYPDPHQDAQFAGHLVASSCAREGKDPVLSRERALVQARKELAESIRVQVESSSRLEHARQENDAEISEASVLRTFISEVASEALIGSRIVKIVEHKNDDGNWMCVLVGMDKATAREVVQSSAVRAHLAPARLNGTMQAFFASLSDEQLP